MGVDREEDEDLPGCQHVQVRLWHHWLQVHPASGRILESQSQPMSLEVGYTPWLQLSHPSQGFLAFLQVPLPPQLQLDQVLPEGRHFPSDLHLQQDLGGPGDPSHPVEQHQEW